MKIKVIACDVLNRELSWLSSQTENFIDITYMHQGLHNVPDYLRDAVQKAIDAVDEGFPYNHSGLDPHYDAVVLAYGLCSNGLSGIRAGKVPLVIPRAHDCITLMLGSKERYRTEFDGHPGTYWYSSGWIERGWQPSERKYKALEKDFLERYGEENAEWLVEQELQSLKTYNRLAFIRMDGIGNQHGMAQFTQDSAEYLKLKYEELDGDLGILKRLLEGTFLPEEVLVVPPGCTIAPSFGPDILKLGEEEA